MDIRSETLLSGRKGLVVGIANEHTIAYGCARVLRAVGAARSITGDTVYIDGGFHIIA